MLISDPAQSATASGMNNPRAILAPRFATRRSRVSGAADTAAHGALRRCATGASNVVDAAAIPPTRSAV